MLKLCQIFGPEIPTFFCSSVNITTTEAATELDLNTEENQSTTLSNFGANIQMDQCCACPGPTTTLSILSDNQQSKFHFSYKNTVFENYL